MTEYQYAVVQWSKMTSYGHIPSLCGSSEAGLCVTVLALETRKLVIVRSSGEVPSPGGGRARMKAAAPPEPSPLLHEASNDTSTSNRAPLQLWS